MLWLRWLTRSERHSESPKRSARLGAAAEGSGGHSERRWTPFGGEICGDARAPFDASLECVQRLEPLQGSLRERADVVEEVPRAKIHIAERATHPILMAASVLQQQPLELGQHPGQHIAFELVPPLGEVGAPVEA